MSHSRPPSPVLPSPDSIRVKISHLILRNPRYFEEKEQSQGQSQDGSATEKQSQLSQATTASAPSLDPTIDEEDESFIQLSAVPQKIRKSSGFKILGPLTPQCLELSSSSDGSPENNPLLYSPVKPRLRAMSLVALQYLNRAQSPTPGSDAIAEPLIESPTSSGKMDWIEYSRPIRILEEACFAENDSQWSGSIGDHDDDLDGPMIITPQHSKPNRPVIIADGELAELLGQPRNTNAQVGDGDMVDLFEMPGHFEALDPNIIKIEPPRAVSQKAKAASSPRVGSGSKSSRSGRPFELGSSITATALTEDVFNTPASQERSSGDEAAPTLQCSACDRAEIWMLGKRVLPCMHTMCSSCFSSSISAVSVTRGPTRCPACLRQIITFEPLHSKQHGQSTLQFMPMKLNDTHVDPGRFKDYPIPMKKKKKVDTVVMRIDNVAWDLTPAVVEAFLPPDTLSKEVVQPVHILLDRHDGRTKDYIYIEVDSSESSQLILKTRQNTFMSNDSLKGRMRPVTITPVSHGELISEIRPRCAAEIHALGMLCQASISTIPNAAAKLIKTRYGPYYALLSVMSKLSGKASPAYVIL